MKYLTCILVLALLAINAPAQTPTLFSALGTVKDKVRREKGEKVGKRIRELRKHNKNVDNALADFERNEKRNGHKPRIDEAESFTTTEPVVALNRSGDIFQKVSYKPQPQTGYSVEVIAIATYEGPAEWQGTVIANKYDSSGGFLANYVANVIIGPDPTYTAPDVVLEISYEGGQAYLECGDIASTEPLGTPEGPVWAVPQARSKGGATFTKASFQGGIIAREIARRVIQSPRTKSYLKCVWVGSIGAGVACGAGSVAFAGQPFIPCLLIGGTGVNTVCAISSFWP
jgi:hypothetical protein